MLVRENKKPGWSIRFLKVYPCFFPKNPDFDKGGRMSAWLKEELIAVGLKIRRF